MCLDLFIFFIFYRQKHFREALFFFNTVDRRQSVMQSNSQSMNEMSITSVCEIKTIQHHSSLALVRLFSKMKMGTF